MQLQTLTVHLGERSYPIFIGTGLLGNPGLLAPHLAADQILVVSNKTVAPLYLPAAEAMLRGARPGAAVESCILPDGEQFKTLDCLALIFDRLLELGFNRRATVVALGGGVIGDMAGFAAACYQRGVPFVQMPTTLLSQVDSSVGGKTGVNHPLGKNMIGAFYQPQAVLIDTDTLRTLPEREFSAGMAEIIKYGLIADAQFFDWLEQNIQLLMSRDTACLQYAIARSCQIKACVVAEDEKEGGRRAILNFGHTYGHAIETEMGYGNWLHGEAVAAGMAMACELSAALGWLDDCTLQRARRLLQQAQLPIEAPADMSADAFERHMKVDKKVLDGNIRLVLLEACGRAVVTSDFDPTKLRAQLRRSL